MNGLWRVVVLALVGPMVAECSSTGACRAQSFGSCIHLDGVNDEARSNAGFNLPEFTVELWVRATSASNMTQNRTRAGLVAYGTFARSPWLVALNVFGPPQRPVSATSVQAGLNYIDGGGFDVNSPGSTPIGQATWRHVAMTYDGQRLRTYLDGTIDADVAATVAPFTVPDSQLFIGPDWPGGAEYLGGDIDEVRIWNYARSGNQIACERFVPLLGTEAGRHAYYTFDEESGQTVIDRSGHGRNAFLGARDFVESADPTREASTVPSAVQASPQLTNVCSDGTGEFRATVNASGPFSLLWEARPNEAAAWIPLATGTVPGVGVVAGATGETLTISNPVAPGTLLRCVMSNPCGTFVSQSVSLVVTAPADLDNDGNFGNGGAPDGAVTVEDLLYFLVGFEQGDARIDLDNDGEPAAGVSDGAVTIEDLLFFLAHFEAGC